MSLLDMPTPSPGGKGSDLATRLLTASLRTMLRSPSVELPADLALERLRALTVAGAQLTALQAESVRDVTRRELFTLDGAASTAAWLRQQDVGVLPGATPAAAARLDRLPLVEQAVRDGVLAPRSAEVLARAVASIPDDPCVLQDGALAAVVRDGVAMVLAEARGGEPDGDDAWTLLRLSLADLATQPLGVHATLEQAFLVVAQHLPPGHLADALQRLTDALRPEELERQAQSAHDARSATLVRNSGGRGWRLTAELDDETGELCSRLFTTYDRIERDTTVGLQGLIRSKTQRRHDALSAAIRFALDSGQLPTDGGVRPHIAVTVCADQLAALAGSLPARTDSGSSVPASTLARWLCDSDVMLVLLSDKPRGHALDVGRTWRTATPQQRTAIRATWAGCATRGCTRGHRHTTPHHVQRWSLGGRTDMDNLVPLCDSCHRDLHEGDRTLQLTDGRRIGPDGWVTAPPG